MRLIDADQLLDFIRFDERVIAPEKHTAQDIVMMIHTAPTISLPPNDPLTISELREMDGEPAYFQFGDGTQGWAIVEKDVESIVLYGPDFDDHTYPDGDFINMEYNDPAGHFGLHVLGWRAYRRKPEEVTIQ